jgi:hypothetical protein
MHGICIEKQFTFATIEWHWQKPMPLLSKNFHKTTLASLMKKILLLLLFSAITTAVWSQPPPPPPPSPSGGGSGTSVPIDTDVLYFIIPAALFAVYRLNKVRFKSV